MKTRHGIITGIVCLVVGMLSAAFAQAQQAAPASAELKWVNAPASFAPGAKLALLKGDLAKPGTFEFHLKLPAGYQFRPQSSSAIRRIVVVSGTFNYGDGEEFDKARTIPMHAGYVQWLDKRPYFAWTSEETVLQIDGVGPLAIAYVNAADDPMKKKHVSSRAIR